VLKALPTAAGTEARVQLVRVTEARGLTHATPDLMKLAAGSDEKVSQAALVALAALAGPQDLRALMVLIGSCTNSAVREAAGDAMVRVAARTGQIESAGEAALENLRRATNAQFRLSWISILTSLGYAKALPAIKEAMADLDETVAANAISQVGRWPDPAPVEDLLTVAEQAANPIHRRLALDSALQLVTVAADERQRPAEIIFSWLQRADKATQSAQFKRRILSALGRLKLMGSLSLAASYLKNTELQTEAAQAVIQIAPALVTQGDTGLLLEALETISATAQNPGIREQARNIAQSIPKESQPQQLFDGKTFDGWEGNLKLFRVEDGAIVAGNLKEPIPQNEFLCTRKEYDNFELRLKFKLLGQGANGGVQVRSRRIPNNHEMAGYQADMGDGWWGCLYDEGRRWKVLAGPAPADRDKIIRREDWNQYVIRCQGRRIQLWVNDQKTVDYTEPDASLPQRGVIGLQIHSGGPTEAWYKDIQLRPLPDKE